MKTITKEWLREQGACTEGYDWFIRQRARDEVKVLEHLIKEEKYDWANWLIVRRMERKQYIQYAIYAAEQVIEIYEKQYPDDKRPRQAIEAARRCLTDDSSAARAAYSAADSAASAAYSAADSAAYSAADSAADSAASAAYSAAYSAARAAYSAAYSAASAAYSAARAAYSAADSAALEEMQKKILAYGISLLEGTNGNS